MSRAGARKGLKVRRILQACLSVALFAGSDGCTSITDVIERDGAQRLQGAVGRPAWSADSKEIYFTTGEGPQVTTFRLQAVNVRSGKVRTLASVTGWNTGGYVSRTTLDGTDVYFAIGNASGNGQYTVRRVPSTGGEVTTLATNAGWPWFSISASGNRLAYPGSRNSSDTILVARVGLSGASSPTAIPTPPRPRVVGLSPGGEGLVYQAESGTYLVSASGGTHDLIRPAAPRFPLEEVETLAPQILWRNLTPHLLFGSFEGAAGSGTAFFHNVDGTNGSRTLVGSVAGAVGPPRNLARSSDGRSLAAWVPVSIEDSNVERTTYRFHLYVQEEGGPSQALLNWKSDESLSWLEFSPDARRIGLVLMGSLFVADLN